MVVIEVKPFTQFCMVKGGKLLSSYQVSVAFLLGIYDPHRRFSWKRQEM